MRPIFFFRRGAAVLWGLLVLLSACTLATSQTPTAIPLTTAPIVRLISPLPNAAYLPGVAVPIQASISSAGADIARVTIVIDEAIVETLPDANPTAALTFSVRYLWTPTALGTHTIDVIAYRADETRSDSVTTTVRIVERGSLEAQIVDPPTAALTAETPAGDAPTPEAQTTAPAVDARPTATATDTTPVALTVAFPQTTNVRRGPDMRFDPPIGTFAAGDTTQVIGANQAGTWLLVRYGGGEGWVLTELVRLSGDIGAVPRLPEPATPTPRPGAGGATAFAPQPSATPITRANLRIDAVTLDPAAPICNETFIARVTVTNIGTDATPRPARLRIDDLRAADSTVQATIDSGIPVLAAGASFTATLPLTVSTWYGEQHRLVVVVNPDGAINETDDEDNRSSTTYTLDRGGCP